MSRDVVFVIGAPRSGTTWVQQMLGGHPSIATSQETDLFDGYLAHWRTTWAAQLPASGEEWRNRRFKGLPAVLTEEAFEQLIRDVVDRVHDEVLRLKPSATIVLEKVPGYALQADAILATFPEARFVHVLRDGRDAIASMLRASKGWGSWWAPSSAAAAAAVWRDFVVAGRRIAELTPRYLEVRYEDLRGENGPRTLAEVLEFAGASSAGARELYGRFALERRGDGIVESSFVWGGEVRARIGASPDEPAGFVGEGTVGGWRSALSAYDQLIVDRVAGTLLRELGYTSGDWLPGRRALRAFLESRLLAARGIESVRYHARRVWA